MFYLKWIKNKAAMIKAAIAEDMTRNRYLTYDQRERKRSRAIRRISVGLMAFMMLTTVFGVTAFASPAGPVMPAAPRTEGVDTFNTVVQFIVDWVARIGLVIGFVGAVQFAMGFKDDSADGKTRGLMCLASGFIVFAVAKAYDMFTV